MSKDQVMGLAIFVLSVLGIILYGWFVYGWPLITLQITAFLAVALVLVIAAWIGYTMATTPPPAPLEPTQTSAASEPTSTTNTETEAQDTGSNFSDQFQHNTSTFKPLPILYLPGKY